MDAKQIMGRHDSDQTLHYVDPPYVFDTRYKGQKTKIYKYEMQDAEHAELCMFLKDMAGTVVLSGYDNEVYNDILNGWFKSTRKAYADGARERTEVLWINRQSKIYRQSHIPFG